jgi:hypothetical protein
MVARAVDLIERADQARVERERVPPYRHDLVEHAPVFRHEVREHIDPPFEPVPVEREGAHVVEADSFGLGVRHGDLKART